MRQSASSRARLSIGEVLEQLRGDFPGLNISKIRFLEAEGLIEPERTPSGYRKFSHQDVGPDPRTPSADRRGRGAQDYA